MSYYITTLKNMGRGLLSSFVVAKKSDKSIPVMEKSFKFDPRHYEKYKKMTDWSNKEIHPVYPYCLLTDLHFLLVSNQHFPYSAFGFLHYKEEIKLLKKLIPGMWKLTCELSNLQKNEYEISFYIKSCLYVDSELHWESKTFAIKKTGVKKNKSTKNFIDVSPLIKSSHYLKTSKALDYGLLSFNLDPIHLHTLTAKLMGHKSNIMHGMWGVAFSLSKLDELNTFLDLERVNLDIKFISPMFLPREVDFFCDEKEALFGLFSRDKNCPHFVINKN